MGRGDASGFAVANDASEMQANAKAKQAIFDKLLASEATESGFVHALRPDHHFVSDGFVIGASIGFPLGKDMPCRDKQSASNSDDGLVGVFVLGKAFVLSIPIGIRADSSPGSLTESPTKFFAALFGDGFLLMFLTTFMDTSTKASVTDQFLGV